MEGYRQSTVSGGVCARETLPPAAYSESALELSSFGFAVPGGGERRTREPKADEPMGRCGQGGRP